MERSSDAAEIERSLLQIAAQYGFSSVFAGIVPTARCRIAFNDENHFRLFFDICLDT